MKDILVILASRGRPQKIEQSIQSWRDKTEGYSSLLVCLDEDDPTNKDYLRHEDVNYRIGPRLKLCPTINAVVKEFPDYNYYAFIGDDHVFRTPWESKAMQIITVKGAGWGIVYGDDLLMRQELPTAAILSGNIVRTLGYMALPGTIHLFMDNFWKTIGEGIHRLFYEPTIIIEHMHYTVNKSERDEQYLEVNSSPVLLHDQEIFRKWVDEGGLADDVLKLKEAMYGV